MLSRTLARHLSVFCATAALAVASCAELRQYPGEAPKDAAGPAPERGRDARVQLDPDASAPVVADAQEEPEPEPDAAPEEPDTAEPADAAAPPPPPVDAPPVMPPPAAVDMGPSCTNVCTLGQRRCQGGGLQECTMSGACTAWSTPMSCAGAMSCRESGGSASCGCSGGCSLGAKQCSGNGVRECILEGGCPNWGPTAACQSPRRCESGSCECPATCEVGQRRCNSAGDAEQCQQVSGCPAWRTQQVCNNFVCDRGVCAEFECRSGHVLCDLKECRQLRGACTVDTEHNVGPLQACSYDSGVRRYASTNDPARVRQECRAMILEVARAKCAIQPDNWQASWVAFKGNGFPLQGSAMMFGTCTPTVAITSDNWGAVENF